MVHWRGFGHDFKTHLLEVLNRPTSGLLDCFSQWKTRLTTASQAVCNILRGETAFRQDEDNVESFSSSGSVMLLPVSTPGLVQRTPLVIEFFSSVITVRLIGIRYTNDFFPKLNISIKDRQIGGQSLRLALHNRFWITVGCLLLWRKIRQQSRG